MNEYGLLLTDFFQTFWVEFGLKNPRTLVSLRSHPVLRGGSLGKAQATTTGRCIRRLLIDLWIEPYQPWCYTQINTPKDRFQKYILSNKNHWTSPKMPTVKRNQEPSVVAFEGRAECTRDLSACASSASSSASSASSAASASCDIAVEFQNKHIILYIYPPTLPRLGQGRAAPGSTVGVERCFLSKPPSTVPLPLTCFGMDASLRPPVPISKASPQPKPPWIELQLGFRLAPSLFLWDFKTDGWIWFPKRRMAPRPWKASPRLSRFSHHWPQWPQPIFPPMATVASQAQDSNYIWFPKATDGTSPLKGLAAPEPIFPPMATVASQAQDSNYMVSESDGWHLALERPRRAWADFPTTGHSGLSRFSHQWPQWRAPGQQLYGFRKRRMAPRPWKASRLSRFSHQWPQWPARPRTPIIWFPKATDGTSPFKGLAAPEPIFPPLATVASADFPTNGHNGQPGPGQQFP